MKTAKFNIGQIVHHKLFHYRGVIIGVDDSMQLSEEWYNKVAKSKPPKDKPWYRVLVDQHEHTTYVAEINLEPSEDFEPITHPLINDFFEKFEDDRYVINVQRFQ